MCVFFYFSFINRKFFEAHGEFPLRASNRSSFNPDIRSINGTKWPHIAIESYNPFNIPLFKYNYILLTSAGRNVIVVLILAGFGCDSWPCYITCDMHADFGYHVHRSSCRHSAGGLRQSKIDLLSFKSNRAANLHFNHTSFVSDFHFFSLFFKFSNCRR